MYMPLMVDVRRALVFGGERGEGLQKLQKLSLYADELLLVAENLATLDPESRTQGLLLKAGTLSELKEKLRLEKDRLIPVHALEAAQADIEGLVRNASFVCSDLSDPVLNQKVYDACTKHGVLCNVIDTKPLCNTWFMSLIETDNLLLGLSTKGRCAYFASRLRQDLQKPIEKKEPWARLLIACRELVPRAKRYSALVFLDRGLLRRPLLRFWLLCFGFEAALALARRFLAGAKFLAEETPDPSKAA